MPKYASATEVTVAASQMEVERILSRYGATSFMRGWEGNRVAIVFSIHNRRVRFILPMPDMKEFRLTESGRARTSETAIEAAWEQACRQRWRALCLVVKAKLEAVEAEISTFEEEFMAFIVLPNGGTVGEFMSPQIEAAYQTGVMPPLLPAGDR